MMLRLLLYIFENEIRDYFKSEKSWFCALLPLFCQVKVYFDRETIIFPCYFHLYTAKTCSEHYEKLTSEYCTTGSRHLQVT